METEINRQLVHISGLAFVLLAQFIGQTVTIWFFTMAATLFVYALYIRQEQKHLRLLERLESRIRNIAISLERQAVPLPFTGAIWFFFACGLVFLFLPQAIASAAALTLIVGDGLATLVGVKLGRHKIIGQKSFEGSVACFLGSLSSSAFIPFMPALMGAFAAAIIELVPELKSLKRLRRKGLIDDNWMVPLLVGLLLYVIIF